VPKITECPQPSRNDLAAQRVAIFGYDPLASHAHGEGGIAFRYEPTPWVCQSNHVHEGGTSGPATAGANGDDFFEALSFQAGAGLVAAKNNVLTFEKVSRFAHFALTEAQYGELIAYRGGCRCCDPGARPPCGVCTAPINLLEASELGFLDDGGIEIPSWLQGPIRESDRPGITALAAKNAKPAPEPVLSIGGSEFDSAELLEALNIVRARKSAPVKETPRGLMVVAPIDHRCGRWNEA
jgi:hypothetical protein